MIQGYETQTYSLECSREEAKHIIDVVGGTFLYRNKEKCKYPDSHLPTDEMMVGFVPFDNDFHKGRLYIRPKAEVKLIKRMEVMPF
jgi:hypothetical protein